MAAVKVSPKYQIVIPLEVRKQMGIKPGQKFEV
ncbi:MAG: AbrB/MazE/SpoVT family DNA-binding domain-containing protein, partial [Gemmatimonadota bacterium]